MRATERNIVVQAFDSGTDFYSVAKVALAISMLAVALFGCGKKLQMGSGSSTNTGGNNSAPLVTGSTIADTQSARAVRTMDGQGNQVVRVTFRPRVQNLKFTHVRVEGITSQLSEAAGTPCLTNVTDRQALILTLPNSDMSSFQLQGVSANDPGSVGSITIPVVAENPMQNMVVDSATGAVQSAANAQPILTCRLTEGSPVSVALSRVDRLVGFTLAVKDADAANRGLKFTAFLDFGDGSPIKVGDVDAAAALNKPVMIEHLYGDTSPRLARLVTINQHGLRGVTTIPVFNPSQTAVPRYYVEKLAANFDQVIPTETLKPMKPTSVVVVGNGEDMTGGSKVVGYHMSGPVPTKLFEFTPRVTGTTPYAKGLRLALGDTNGDGNLDIITGYEDGDMISIHSGVDLTPLGQATGIFGNNGRPTYVAASDMDADGKAEIVVSTSEDDVRLLRLTAASQGATPATFQISMELDKPFGNANNNLRPTMLGENVLFTRMGTNEVRGYKRRVADGSFFNQNPSQENNNNDSNTLAALGWGRQNTANGPVRTTQMAFSNARQNSGNANDAPRSRILIFDSSNPLAAIAISTFQWIDYSGVNRLSAGDFNGDGISDFIAASGPYDKTGGNTRYSEVRFYEGRTGGEMSVNNVPMRLNPFPTYEQGLYAAGFVNP